jgi:hypothetical protein
VCAKRFSLLVFVWCNTGARARATERALAEGHTSERTQSGRRREATSKYLAATRGMLPRN